MYTVNFDSFSFNKRNPNIGREYASHINSAVIYGLWGNLDDAWKVTELEPLVSYTLTDGTDTIYVVCVYTDIEPKF